MQIKTLPQYTTFNDLTSSLIYLHTSNDVFVQGFEDKGLISLYCYFDSEKKTYNFYFQILDQKVEIAFLNLKGETSYVEFKNKKDFLTKLKTKIDLLINVMQQHGYKFSYNPEIELEDFEQLDDFLELDEKTEENSEDIGKSSLNKILLYHNILGYSLFKQPYKSNNVINIEINDLSSKSIELFPSENKYFTDISLTVEGIPNLYFPSLVTLKIEKKLKFKGEKYNIKYCSQLGLKDIGLIVRYYYLRFKKSSEKSPEILNFSTKLLEIVKNPYGSNNISPNLTPEEAINRSQCPKCNSRSSLFNITLGNVNIKTKMGAFSTAPLVGENIIDYKDIISVQCLECSNYLIENKQREKDYKNRRNFISTEDWTSEIHKKPILDDDEREVIINYDLLTAEVEFELTNPLLPKIEYQQIINVGKVIGWTDPTNNQYISFLKNYK